MQKMFSDAGRNATTWSIGDLSSWDTSSVTDMGYIFTNAGCNATTWSVTIPPTNGNGINNTTDRIYGSTTSISNPPCSGKAFTLAN